MSFLFDPFPDSRANKKGQASAELLLPIASAPASVSSRIRLFDSRIASGAVSTLSACLSPLSELYRLLQEYAEQHQ